MEYVYVAMWVSADKESQVIAVHKTRDSLTQYIMEYFGILPEAKYTNPSKYLGYTDCTICEHPDDLEGYYTFEDYNQYEHQIEIDKVYVYCKYINEKCN